MIHKQYIFKFLKRSAALLFMLLITCFFSQAQNVEFKASAPNVVRENEQFNLTYTFNQEPDNVQLPNINSFQVLGGPSTSSSSSVQIINGKVSRSSSVSYTYLLVAGSKGNFTIPPATATIKGKSYQSNSISIEVLPGNAAAGNNAGSNNSAAGQGSEDNTASNSVNANGKNVFVRLLVNKKEAYVGQEIIAWIKLYTRLPISDYDRSFSGPEFTGFFKQDVDMPPLRSLQRENVGGQIYNSGTLMKVILYPQRSGDITIKPFDLDVLVQQQVNQRSRSIFDDFFNNSVRNVKVTLTSKPVTLHIKPLPAEQPPSFNGAVGKFNINATINNTTVKTNEAITLKVNVSGSGNLKLLDNLTVDFPSDIESYDPTTTSNIKNTDQGAIGEKTFEYTLIPRYAGNFHIPSVKLSYFDPDTRSYRTISTKDFNITVNKGEDDTSSVIVSGMSKEEVKLLGSDIRFIKKEGFKLHHQGMFLFGSLPFNLAFVIAFVLFLLIIIVRRETIRRNADIVMVKNRKASKYAHKRLRQAARLMHQQKQTEFYEEVSKALWGYLGDKLSIPVAKLSRETSREELVRRKIAEETMDEFFGLIDTCEYARFAPSTESSDMNKIYNDAAKIISRLQQKIK